MRFVTSVFAAALYSGVFFTAAAANAQRLNDEYNLADLNDPNHNTAFFEIFGTSALVEGTVDGIGTDGDEVSIFYITPRPTNVNADDKQARVRQSSFSSLDIEIESETPERNLDLGLLPEKCQIDGKVNAANGTGDVTVKCSGDDLFAAVTADELASIQAAFLNDKQVKIKAKSDGSKGSISIRLKGTATVD